MLSSIKEVIQKIFNFFGFKIVGIKKLIKHNSFDALHEFIIKNFCKGEKLIILDIGANEGDSVYRFKKIFPDSKIYCFEPNEELLNLVNSKNKFDNVIKNNFAIGAKKEKKEFYFYNSHRISSFYPVVERSKYQRLKVQGKKDFIVKKVNVETLDEYCLSNNIKDIDILKIDTQGSEAEVLMGAENLLHNKRIKIVELEYILGIAHQNANVLYDIENELNKSSYKLIAIENSGNIISFSRYQTNLIYVREDIYKKIQLMHEADQNLKY